MLAHLRRVVPSTLQHLKVSQRSFASLSQEVSERMSHGVRPGVLSNDSTPGKNRHRGQFA
jgi:hypothetical protein